MYYSNLVYYDILTIAECPKSFEQYFSDPKMRLYYHFIQLKFEADFSNVLMIHISCHGPMLPNHTINEKELVSEIMLSLPCTLTLQETLGLSVRKVTEASYEISNLLVLKVKLMKIIL